LTYRFHIFLTTSCASSAVTFPPAVTFPEEELLVLVPEVADRDGLAVALMLDGVVGFEAEVEE